MLLEKIYKDFGKHTSLTDSVYELVFLKIKEKLDFVGSITWLYLEYTDVERGDVKRYDFLKHTSVPSYIVELIYNVFESYYTLPEQITVTIGILKNNVASLIVSTSKGTIIPLELQQLKDDNLYKLYFLNTDVYDLFGEFDTLFDFLENMKSNPSGVFPPLIKKFESDHGKDQVINNELTPSNVVSSQLNVEKIQEKIREILAKVDTIRQQRDKTIVDKNDIFSKVNSRDSVVFEQEKISIEYKTMRETYDIYQQRLNKVNDVLKDIEAELTDSVNFGENSPEREVFINKKIVFNREKESLANYLLDVHNVMTNITNRFNEINSSLQLVESYSVNDVNVLDKKIKDLDKEQDDLYGFLISLEGQLKQQKNKMESDSFRIERAASFENMAIQEIENTAIVSHLASPLQPAAVLTVINYLRYYFSYYSTIISKKLISENVDIDVYTAQAIATRIVLTQYFGIFFNTVFSFASFVDNRIKKLILIQK